MKLFLSLFCLSSLLLLSSCLEEDKRDVRQVTARQVVERMEFVRHADTGLVFAVSIKTASSSESVNKLWISTTLIPNQYIDAKLEKLIINSR